MRPCPREAGEHVAELGELDLDLALARAGALREDVHDQLSPVDDAAPGELLEILHLGGAELVVEDNEFCLFPRAERAQLVRLALADVVRRVRRVEFLHECARHLGPGRQRQLAELGEVVLDLPPACLPRLEADEDGALVGPRRRDCAAVMSGHRLLHSAIPGA